VLPSGPNASEVPGEEAVDSSEPPKRKEYSLSFCRRVKRTLGWITCRIWNSIPFLFLRTLIEIGRVFFLVVWEGFYWLRVGLEDSSILKKIFWSILYWGGVVVGCFGLYMFVLFFFHYWYFGLWALVASGISSLLSGLGLAFSLLVRADSFGFSLPK